MAEFDTHLNTNGEEAASVSTSTEKTESMSLLLGNSVIWASGTEQGQYHQTDSLDIVVLGEPRVYGQAEKLDASSLLALFDSFGPVFIEQISGRFLVLIVDKRNGSVSVFNDHLGSIPVYKASLGNKIMLASSMMDIEGSSETQLPISSQALFNYVYFHCIPAPLTIYEGVEKLTPGAVWTFKNTECCTFTYYEPKFSTSTGDLEKAQQECLDKIERAVAHSTEQNCGAFLSGGLDSSTVAGMLAKTQNPAKTFSVGFNEPGYDETEYAELSATHFGTEHESVYLEPAFIRDNFVKVASSFDEPFGNSSALAAFFCASYAKSKGIDVMLAGDGGDELFAGNSRYAKQKLFRPYEQLPSAGKAILKGMFVQSPLGSLPLGSKAKSYILQAENPLPDRLQAYNFLHRFAPEDVFCESVLEHVDKKAPIHALRERFHQAKAESNIDKMLFMDWKFTLADNDLVKVSKMCELAGVKVKFPLIDKELVDFSCTISADDKLPGQKLRHFFKQSMKSFLANETLEKPKHGFGLPFGRWMRTDEGLIDVTLSALQSLRKRNIIKPEFIDIALEMQSNQHSAYYGELIWILSVLELWLQSRGR